MAPDGHDGALRQLEPHWNNGMIVASVAISLLGAFTSTQLMCQAKVSIGLRAVFVWILLASLTFGFCSIWCLHFVAMLAYELDIQIGINVPLTILSAVLAVVFTFTALGSDLLYDTYHKERNKKKKASRKWKGTNGTSSHRSEGTSLVEARPLLSHAEDAEEFDIPAEMRDLESAPINFESNDEDLQGKTNGEINGHMELVLSPRVHAQNGSSKTKFNLPTPEQPSSSEEEPTSNTEEETANTDSEHSVSGRSSSLLGSSTTSTFGLNSIMNYAYRSTTPAKNVFKATAETLYHGWTTKNVVKGFVWSLAITSMHYSGVLALRIPEGHCKLNYIFVLLSAAISWVVCIVGCILMSHMESHLRQQFLFSIVASTGVAAMHFTGMRAVTFWSRSPPTDARGYPPALATAIVSIAIITCIAANGLLAHAVTVSRDKLAEIVMTRKKLWKTIAQKENAEAAAAARSEFIASASHEIRTPLHHLQGYSDLLFQTELTEEGRTLLLAIQRATKTLSLSKFKCLESKLSSLMSTVTNNVLDWSKLERDSETVCRPVALDIRTICEAVLVLLPNKDDEAEVEVMVVVSPDVPNSIFLDETYIHRILMNLLSNALKFTSSGYILLLVEIKGGNLIISVQDTGAGIPLSFLPDLFEPFKQAQTRGSQRGTGLGLSIVKQLLQNMNGHISVKSRHPDTDDVEQGTTGSTFTISIPVQAAGTSDHLANGTSPKIAILHNDNHRSMEGLQIAWKKFGYEVVTAKKFSDLPSADWKYIWADVSFLKANSDCCQALLQQAKSPVLVAYDSIHTIYQVPELGSAPQFVPLPRPSIWHLFSQRVAAHAAGQDSSKPKSQLVRFASKVDLVDVNGESQEQKPTEKNLVILLVEDNLINQKLGQKMLTVLGYKVQAALNGQEAIDLILKNDTKFDAILMDQSMPLKDGITATKEIRDLEATGTLSRRHPIIAVTAVVNTQAQAEFKSAGADDFLAKPLSLAKLEHTLSIHLPVKWR